MGSIVQDARAQSKVNISGFGDFTFESSFGETPDEDVEELYEDFGLLQEFSEPRTDLLFPGFHLILSSNLKDDKLKFLTEIVSDQKSGLYELKDSCWNGSLKTINGIFLSVVYFNVLNLNMK